MNVEPNFFIIGSTKSGTTSLFQYLAQHPEIGLCRVKEPHYFTDKLGKFYANGPNDTKNSWLTTGSLEEYLRLFNGTEGYKAVGEASTSYLSTPGVAELIHRHFPEAKIVAILRHPVERAFSAYMHLRREGRETLSFEQALAAEPDRIRQKWELLWYYRKLGHYHEQLIPYMRLFDPTQRLVVPYETWKADPIRFIRRMALFLGVDPEYSFDLSYRDNVAGVPRSSALYKFTQEKNLIKNIMKPLIPHRLRTYMKQSIRDANLKQVQLSDRTRKELSDYYRSDIDQVCRLAGSEFEIWKNKF